MASMTLAETRAACVGPRYPHYEKSFNLFDEAGGFRPTFSWPPLIFGIFWFLYRRMYAEAVLIFLGGWAMMRQVTVWGEGPVILLSLGFGLVLAVIGSCLYWRAVDRRLEKAMRLFPHQPEQALAWLKAKGGVDPWIPLIVVMVLMGLSFSSAPGGGGQ